VTRTTDAGTGSSLRVYLELGGTAVRGTDYTTTGLSFAGGTTCYAQILGNQASVNVTFTPTLDNLIEGEETITYSLLGPLLAGHDYTIGEPDSGAALMGAVDSYSLQALGNMFASTEKAMNPWLTPRGSERGQ
jgi:hypothetical protein